MFRDWRMSIRFKIMIASLIVITFVVSVITSHANFPRDRRATSPTSARWSGHIADEANTLSTTSRPASIVRRGGLRSLLAADPQRVEPHGLDFPYVVALSLYRARRCAIYSPDP